MQDQTEIAQRHKCVSPSREVDRETLRKGKHLSSVAVGQAYGESVWNRLAKWLSWLGVWLSGCWLAQGEPPGTRELAQLQGEWRAVAGERDGQLRPKAFLEALRVRVNGDVLVMELGKRQQSLRIVLNSQVRPKSIDLIHVDGQEKGDVWLGIYTLEEGRWRLCVSRPGSPRPDDFLTRPGSGREILILERKSRN